MKYDLWAPRRRIERAYARALGRIMEQINTLLEGSTDPLDIQRVLRSLAETPEFDGLCRAAAEKMTTSLFSDAGRTWREAARVNTRGRAIYRALREELHGPVGVAVAEQVGRNARMIKTLPRDMAQRAAQYAAQEAEKGRRASDIAEGIKGMFPGYSAQRAACLARTEVSKTGTALTRARAEGMGLDWYIWRTSRDARVRDAHSLLEGALVRWTDPPAPEELSGGKSYGKYHAGEIFNCRCYPEPVVDFNSVRWPCKVYYDGKIVRMTRAQFKGIMQKEGCA